MRALSYLLLWLLLASGAAWAERVSFSLQALHQAVDAEEAAPTTLTAMMASRLQAAYAALGLAWRDQGLALSLPVQSYPIVTGCSYSAELERLDTVLLLQDSASASLAFTALQAPLTMTVDLPFQLEGSGTAVQRFGVSAFGRCSRYGRDSFSLGLRGGGRLLLQIVIDPRLSLTRTRLRVAPHVAVSIRWADIRYDVDVDHTAASSLIESRLRDRIDELFSDTRASEAARQLEQRLRQRLVDAWGSDVLELALPALDDGQFADLQQLLGDAQRFATGERYLRDHLALLWYALLSGDRQTGGSTFVAALLCEVTAQKALPVVAAPVYTQQGSQCRAVAPAAIDATIGTQRFYADAACRDAIDVKPVSQQQFCRDNFDPRRVGDGALLPQAGAGWYLSPGTRTDIALVSTAGLPQPWVTARRYRQVATPAGSCVLEMRIYKNDIAASGLRPMLALHGGNWQFRTRGILGIEAVVPHFTRRGFVVFAPFYRLAGSAEASAACNGASGEDILADVSDALNWVQTHGAEFGADAGKVVVTGQSAGAHLAAWLATHYPQQIERALLFYPPTDMADYLRQWQLGASGPSQDGLDALAAFLKLDDPAQIDLGTALVQDNSLPQIVAQAPAAFPPMFMVHGSADEVVPMRQSARLCNALAGNPDSGPAPMALDTTVQDAHVAIDCDRRGSELHLIAGARHMLDFCLAPSLCAAGDAAGREAARTVLRRGYDWVAAPVQRMAVAGVSEARPAGGGGGGGAGWLLLWSIWLLRQFCRVRYPETAFCIR